MLFEKLLYLDVKISTRIQDGPMKEPTTVELRSQLHNWIQTTNERTGVYGPWFLKQKHLSEGLCASVHLPTVAELPGAQIWHCHQSLISIVLSSSLPALTPIHYLPQTSLCPTQISFVLQLSLSCAVTNTIPFPWDAFSPSFKTEFKRLLLSFLWATLTQLPQLLLS